MSWVKKGGNVSEGGGEGVETVKAYKIQNKFKTLIISINLLGFRFKI